jgi:hypothetical protein
MRRNEHLRYIDRSDGCNLRDAQVVYAGDCDRKVQIVFWPSGTFGAAGALDMLASGECPE